MGLAYYRLDIQAMTTLLPLIADHENDLLGPRARGYWIDQPDDYDYEGVQQIARQLDKAGKRCAHESLELSEVQAHGLSMLEIELEADDNAFAPTLFSTSVMPDVLHERLQFARRQLGTNPERVAAEIRSNERDKRFSGYISKQLRHLREALPLVWRFYERAEAAGEAVLVVDLRARDVEIPDAVELMHME
jgi:hypothetical protein